MQSAYKRTPNDKDEHRKSCGSKGLLWIYSWYPLSQPSSYITADTVNIHRAMSVICNKYTFWWPRRFHLEKNYQLLRWEHGNKSVLNAPFKQRLKGKIHISNNLSTGRLSAYLITSPQKVVESPKQNIEIDRPKSPIRMTGLRPIRSDNRLQCNIVKASVRKNNDCYVS